MTPESEKRRAYRERYRNDPVNKERAKALRKARYAANPEKYVAMQRKYYYGLTPESGEKLFLAQGKRCAICRTDAPKGRGVWHLDHEHTTGKVRGFLCQQCNSGLGQFRDSPAFMRAAADYVEAACYTGK